jgi:RimJ/RimL family protein N-acetyltransferase
MKYFKKLIGEKCYLSPIRIEDAEQYCEWINDMGVAKFMVFSTQQIGITKEKAILEDMIKRGAQIFAIIDKEKDELIGNCSLFDIDHLHRKAEFGIFIGDKNYWGKGYGTEATKLLLDYGFNILNLNNIMLRVYSYNKRGIRSYEKCDFKVIGSRREVKIIGGKKYDEIYMDILASEFKSVYVNRILESEK